MLQATARRCLPKGPLPTSRTFLGSRHFQTSSRLAEKEDPAFSPDKTKPEEQKERAAEELNEPAMASATADNSPGNPKASQPRSPQEGGSQGSPSEDGSGGSSRTGASGGDSPPKSGSGKQK